MIDHKQPLESWKHSSYSGIETSDRDKFAQTFRTLITHNSNLGLSVLLFMPSNKLAQKVLYIHGG